MSKQLGATVAITLVLGLSALLVWTWNRNAAAPEVPAGAVDASEGAPKAEATKATPERAAHANRPAESAPDAPFEKVTPPPPTPAPAGGGELVVRVIDRATRAPLDAFRTLLRIDGPRREAERTGGEARLEVPFDRKLELAIEAEGYVPSGPLGFEVASSERSRTVTIELDRAMRETGVLLTVRDALGAPQEGILLTAWSLADDGTRREPPLWQRTNRAADGLHKVPDLQVGAHRFEIVALDAKGDPLPLLAKELSVRFGGGEQVPLTAQLESGALVRLAVRDRAGTALGTEVLLRLRQQDTVVDVRWRARGPDGPVVRRGGLPLAGEATLERAIAPGRYVLELARGTEPPLPRDFVVGPGEILALEIVLP